MASRLKNISDDLADRLKSLRKENSLTQKELANKLFKSESTVRMWELGKSEPDLETVNKLSVIFGVSVDYLLGITNTTDNVPTLPSNIFPITKKRLPLLGEIACGVPVYADEQRESYVMTGTDIDADFCLKAKGDSMIGARIMDGDIVFIKRQDIVDNGEIAAVIIEDEATLKRVYYDRDNNELVLQAENSKYRPIVLRNDALDTVHILGKAVAFQSDVK